MRLVRLKVSNFRCYRNETSIDFKDLTILVGRNDAGKSALLEALDIFFNEQARLDEDDRNVEDTEGEIRIACTFDQLPAKVVIDARNETSLEAEYLLKSDKTLEIVKYYSPSSSNKAAKPKAVFIRANHPTADSCEDLLSSTITQLKAKAKKLNVDLAGVNQTVSAQLRAAIWESQSELLLQEREIEVSKGDGAKEVWEGIKKYLPVYALFKSDRASTDQDAEAQDPMKLAIKEALVDWVDDLARITKGVEDKVKTVAERTVAKLREMDPHLASQLTPRVVPKSWHTLFNVSLTGDGEIPINKRGSGIRRLVLLSFFRAKADLDAESQSTGVIYAVEEPETSQHPNNQKMLIDAFKDLADVENNQVIITTHNPLLARRFSAEDLRYIFREEGKPAIRTGSEEGIMDALASTLGVIPDHRIKAFLGVEGPNDISFLKNISTILHEAGETDIPDLAVEEKEGRLMIIPMGGSTLDQWVNRLSELNRPEFHIMDRDTTPPALPKYHKQEEDVNARVGCIAWNSVKKELENYIHPGVIKSEYPDYRGTGGDFEDVPCLFAQAVHEKSRSPKPWDDLSDEQKGKKESAGKKRLNGDFVQKMTREQIVAMDPHGFLRGMLVEIGMALGDVGADGAVSDSVSVGVGLGSMDRRSTSGGFSSPLPAKEAQAEEGGVHRRGGKV